MQITFTLNHKKVTAEIAADTVLLDLVRSLGCKSVKRGCETANCGLCTVFLDEKPVLSCSVQYTAEPKCIVRLIVLTGILQWRYEIQIFLQDNCID